MENKFEVRIDRSVDLNNINSATVLCLSTDYVIDLIKDMFKKYNKTNDLDELLDEFSALVDNAYDVGFDTFESFIQYKSNVFMQMLDIVRRSDEHLAHEGEIAISQVSVSLQTDLNEFVMSLGGIIVDWDKLDLGNAVVKKEYIDSTLEQLSLLNESYLLCRLANVQIEMSPVDTSAYQNLYVENKLKQINKITANCKSTFDGDYDKILDLTMGMYDRLYKLSYSDLTDGEKVDGARRLVKELNPHKKLLDKLENKLTKGNELKRQLTIHKKKLLANLEKDVSELEEGEVKDANNSDVYENSKNTIRFVTNNYVTSINNAVDDINSLEESISARYKTLDLLETALKSAIPTEGELKKLSAPIFKFQELAIKLENALTNAKDKGVKQLLKSAIAGMTSLVESAKDLKELYLRNALVSATFKSVDVIMDFANSGNKGEQVKKLLIVNQNLDNYSKLAIEMSEKFFNVRKIANDSIRNMAITMCKDYSVNTLEVLIAGIDETFKQMREYLLEIDEINKKEIDLIKGILSL